MTTDTRDRILEAALQAMCVHGLSRLTLEDVAGEAGVSRQTLHRYFGTKHALIEAAIVREEETFLDRVRAAADRHEDLRPALEEAVAEALRAAAEHPLLGRLLATEPETLLPFLTTGAGPVLSAARPALERLLSERVPHLSPVQVGRTADVLTRVVVSYAINPPPEPADEVASELADLIVGGLKVEERGDR